MYIGSILMAVTARVIYSISVPEQFPWLLAGSSPPEASTSATRLALAVQLHLIRAH